MKSSTQTFAGPVLALALAFSGGAARAQALDDYSGVEIRTTEAGPGIYMLEGHGGNIGVSVGEDGVFLIDDQYAPLTEKILAAVRALSDQPIRFVLNTHYHPDHVGGNDNLGRAGVVIFAHDNVRTRMKELLGRENSPFTVDSLPVVTFSEDLTFHMNGHTIHAFHLPPAHTDGDVVIHFVEADVIHTGDTFFNPFYPFVDVRSGGSIEGMNRWLERLLEMAGENTRIIPGHGVLATRADVETYQAMQTGVTRAVREAIAQGLTAEQAIAAKITAEWDEAWGGNFVKPAMLINMLYGDLARPAK